MKTDRIRAIYDDEGPFASAYVEVSRDQEDGDRIVELRVRQVADALTAAGAEESVVDLVRESLGRSTGQPAPVSRCVVVSARGVLLDELTRRHRAQSVAGWRPLPDLAEWLADASTGVRFTLVLIDHEGADVSTYGADGIAVEEDASVGEPSVFEQKVHAGGWSQERWQRSAEAVWQRNAKAAAEELNRQVAAERPELIIVAGDERSRGMLLEELSEAALPEIIVLDRAGRAVDGGDDALAAAVEETLRGHVVARELAVLHRLREGLGRGDTAVSGIAAVADAFVPGQVERLVLDREAAAAETLDPADHPGLPLGVATDGPLRADQALIAAAVRTDAEVDFAGSTGLGGAPAAAVLRWPNQPAAATE